ncbi:hypothetical protein Tco_0787029, partial [Tanacetum coccineum]
NYSKSKITLNRTASLILHLSKIINSSGLQVAVKADLGNAIATEMLNGRNDLGRISELIGFKIKFRSL